MLLLRLPGAQRKVGRRNGSRGEAEEGEELCIFRFVMSVIDTLVDVEGVLNLHCPYRWLDTVIPNHTDQVIPISEDQ